MNYQAFKSQTTRLAGILLALLAVISVGLSACQATQETEGKYTHQILATGKVGSNEYNTAPPGSSTILPREYPGAPPLVPHSITELTITKDENPCLSCHIQGLSFGSDHTATKIPESHYIDISSGTRSQDIQGLRYNCLACHLPQSPEEPPWND